MNENEMSKDVIIKTIARILIPPIQLFGLYVIAHGHISPGGGFQGGVIISAGFILYTLVFDYKKGIKKFKLILRKIMEPMGPIIFGSVGLIAIILGGNFLEYSELPMLPNAQAAAIAISIVEIGVGITVIAVIFSIFLAMGGRRK